MAKNDVEKVTEEKLAKGGVLVRLYFDMQHKEKEKLQPLMLDLVNERLMKEPGIVYAYGSVEEPLEKQGSYITSGIITLLVESFRSLVNIVLRYAPAGIEILEPQKGMSFKTNDLQSMLMDLSQITVDYSRYIVERSMKPEEIEQLHKNLEQRAEIGKKLAEKAKEKKTPEK